MDVIFPDQDALGTLVIPTAALLLRGAPHAETGRRLVDHLLSPEVERKLAETAAHMPLRPGVVTPSGVRHVSGLRVMNVDYEKVAAEMERIQPWLRKWVGL